MFSDVLFFQAEDGIRDLVRSRGLGDVYKRQGRGHQPRFSGAGVRLIVYSRAARRCSRSMKRYRPVSYTHLTLPTSDLV